MEREKPNHIWRVMLTTAMPANSPEFWSKRAMTQQNVSTPGCQQYVSFVKPAEPENDGVRNMYNKLIKQN